MDPVHAPPEPRQDYVGSKVCASCHQEIADKYASHPMAMSLGEVADVTPLEDYVKATAFTPRGNRSYRVERTEDGIFHHESMTAIDGSVIYDQSVPIHFAVGSGVHGRSYLTNRDGMLFMSSIGWYAQGRRWDLSPGYRPQSHQRFDRQVSDGCLACHAGRMNRIPGKSDAYDPKQPFLEKSIGCERCHGPGGSHVEKFKAGGDLSLKDYLVNPGGLDQLRQDAICNQCHLQGSTRVTRYGRTEFDFRPGDRLTDIWMVNLASKNSGEFPAVTQAEQMHESACYQKSRRMVCTTCHDPHQHASGEQKAEVYSQRCASCHGATSPDCAATVQERGTQSCIACHMPRMAATDVPHTSQTNHRIPRTARSDVRTKGPKDITFYVEGDFKVPDWEVDRARGILIGESTRRRPDRRSSDRVVALLKPLENRLRDDPVLLQTLAGAYQQLDKKEAALQCWNQALNQFPNDPQVLEGLGLFHHYKGDLREAGKYYEKLIAENPWRAEFHGRYAHVLGQLGRVEEGIASAKRCLELNPTLKHVHLWLAETYDRNGQPELAARQRELHDKQE